MINYKEEEACVCAPDEKVFKLTNRNINDAHSDLIIGHLDYRTHLQLILQFI
jgi:hypothetical protein